MHMTGFLIMIAVILVLIFCELAGKAGRLQSKATDLWIERHCNTRNTRKPR